MRETAEARGLVCVYKIGRTIFQDLAKVNSLLLINPKEPSELEEMK
jgi:hypothetical protein